MTTQSSCPGSALRGPLAVDTLPRTPHPHYKRDTWVTANRRRDILWRLVALIGTTPASSPVGGGACGPRPDRHVGEPSGLLAAFARPAGHDDPPPRTRR